MLSKSQARLFFLLGTLIFALAFLGLTVDSMKKVPSQTNEANMSEEVKRGKEIWDKNNCMGCHTLLGEGAYYAPELTKVYERRGPEWMKLFIKDPQAMYPNERKMIKYNFTDKEIDDLIAFFKWIGNMNLNGFPAKPKTLLSSSASANTNAGITQKEPLKFTQLCRACHALGGKGGNTGPALDGVAKKYDSQYLEKWIANPASIKPGTNMPKLPLSDTELKEIVNFLGEQK